jgi:FtsZ-interacting cell division protein ZipA
MEKSAFLALAASLFTSYPKENTLYFTKDQQGFFTENDATNHAKSLREKESDEPEVLAVTREEAEAFAKEEAQVPALTKEQAEKNVEAAKTANAKLQELYDEMAKKLAEAPENKNFQKSEATRKANLEKGLQALTEAEAALASFA